MKKLLSVLLVIGILLSLVVPFTAFAETSGDFDYEISNGEATITEYIGSDAEVTIPNTLGGYPVTSIGYEAFSYRDSLTSVTIPDSVTTIGNRAFCSCNNLTSVTIGNSVITIGYEAFYYCDSLTSVIIPNSVTTIGYYAFRECTSLISVTIGNGVTTIGHDAFSYCTSLIAVVLPDSVTAIGDDVFKYCNNLTIRGKKGSFAEEYATNHNLTFEVIVVYGDTDENGKISVADALMILKAVVGKVVLTEKQYIVSDTDGDDVVNANDVLNILQKIVGNIDKLPVEDILPSFQPEEQPINVVLASAYADDYTASDAKGRVFASALNEMSKNGLNTTILAINDEIAVNTIVKEILSGVPSSADVYEMSQSMCRNASRHLGARAFTDLDETLFDCAATESVTFSGKAFGLTWASRSMNPMGVIYNKDLVKKYASDYNIVKLFNEKKWDFDNFQAIANACTIDTDGDGKSDIYGFTSNTNIIDMALTSNAGGLALKVNEKVEVTMCSDAGVKALEWCKEMFKTDRSWKYKDDINNCVSEFASGKTAMFVSSLQFYPQIASQAEFDMGVVPMPIGPDQNDYRNGVYENSYYVIPNTRGVRRNIVWKWLSELCEGTSSALLNAQVEILAENGLDAESQEIYKWMVNNMTPEYSSGVFTNSTMEQVRSSVTTTAKKPARVIASIQATAQSECDAYYSLF